MDFRLNSFPKCFRMSFPFTIQISRRLVPKIHAARFIYRLRYIKRRSWIQFTITVKIYTFQFKRSTTFLRVIGLLSFKQTQVAQ
jgi:hypothetical protein